MRFEFDFDAREYRRCFRRIVWHGRHPGWVFGFAVMGAGTAWFLVVIARALTGGGLVALIGFLPWGVLATLWLLATLFWLPFAAARTYRKFFPGTQSMEFTEDALVASSSSASSTRAWSAFSRVLEVRDFFLFYVGRDAASALPKRVIRDAAELNEVRGFLRRKLGSKARLQPES